MKVKDNELQQFQVHSPLSWQLNH